MFVTCNTDSLQTDKIMGTENKESKKANVMWVHLLSVIAVLLSGIHYTCLQYYIKANGSAFLFLIGRTVLTIPMLIGVLIKYKLGSKMDKESVEYGDIELQKKIENANSRLQDLEQLPTLKKEDYSDTASRLKEAHDDKKIPRVAYIPLTFLCICGALRHIIFIVALYFTASHNIAIIQPTIPLFIALFSSCLKIEKLNKYAYICIMLTFIGLCITVRIWNIHSIDLGFFLLLLVPIAKALQVVNISLASKYVNERMIHVYYLSGIFLLTLPITITGEIVLYRNYTIIEGFLKLNYKQILCILYSTIGILLIFWRIQIYIIKHLSPVAVSLYNALQPFCTFLLARIFLKEVITINKYIGTLFICASLLLYQYGGHNNRNSKIIE